jgi:hypothetical protein
MNILQIVGILLDLAFKKSWFLVTHSVLGTDIIEMLC